MARVSIEYPVTTLDGEVTIDVPFDPEYPVAFKLLSSPETWQETIARHRQQEGAN